MPRPRWRFGPLSYLTAGLAVLLLGSQPFWEPTARQFRAWRLTRQLHDPAEPARREAAEELMQLGPAASWWVARASRDPDVRGRVLCCTVLGRLAGAGDEAAAGALLVAIGDGDASVRAAAVPQVGRILAGPAGSIDGRTRDRSLRSLGAALDDPAPEVRRAAAWSLSGLGPDARPAIPDLLRALDGPDKALRPHVASVLLALDAAAARPRVIAALSPLLADPSLPLEHWRLVSVLAAAQGDDATVAMLTPWLRHPDLGIRLQAINDMTTHFPEASSLRSAMIEGLASEDGLLRDEAALYLLKRDPAQAPGAIEALAEQMVAPKEGGSIPEALVRRVRDVSPGSLAPLARSLVDRLARARTPEGRLNAILSLGEIGPEARAAVPALLAQSRSGDLTTATRAIGALVKIDPASAAARVPSLLDWTAPGRESRVRLTAMAALRDLGPAAKAAIPTLLKWADEDDLAISAGAIEAIGRIDPPLGQTLKVAIERGASRPPD